MGILLRISLNSCNEIIAAQKTIQISSNLYENDMCSSHELVKGFTVPIESVIYLKYFLSICSKLYKFF